MKPIILDTDILIDISRADFKALSFVEKIKNESVLCVSIITKMELIIGCRNKLEQKNVEIFLNQFEIIGLNELIGVTAYNLIREYRLSHGLLIPDALIASTSLTNNISLATKNNKDYQFIKGIDLYNY